MAYGTYCLSTPIFWTFNDQTDEERLDRLNFHVEKGDYFPFLATVFGLLKESIDECARSHEGSAATQSDFAETMRQDLIHLYEHYDLVPRAEPRSYSRQKAIQFRQ